MITAELLCLRLVLEFIAINTLYWLLLNSPETRPKLEMFYYSLEFSTLIWRHFLNFKYWYNRPIVLLFLDPFHTMKLSPFYVLYRDNFAHGIFLIFHHYFCTTEKSVISLLLAPFGNPGTRSEQHIGFIIEMHKGGKGKGVSEEEIKC